MPSTGIKQHYVIRSHHRDKEILAIVHDHGWLSPQMQSISEPEYETLKAFGIREITYDQILEVLSADLVD